MKQFCTFLLLCAVSVFSMAQAPALFNYQAVARDLAGNPLPNKTIGIKISILRDTPNSPVAYAETHKPLTNQLGLFAIQIGGGTAVAGSLGSVDWGNASHFLQLELDPNGGSAYQLVGASQLVSVPYALYAEHGGDVIWEKNGNDIFYSIGRVGIGLSNPKSRLNLPASSIIRVEPSTTSDKSGLEIGDSYFYENHVSGNSFPGNTTVTNKLIIGTNPNVDKPIGFFIRNEEKMTIGTNGNIGIGTITPKSKLQVHGGDVYIEDVASGVIMKSPNGNCWRMTVDNNGQPVFSPIACPN